MVIAVALDESADLIEPFTEGITIPVLLDREHTLSETYAITNVPSAVWIDEDDHIVRPNSPTFSNDMFVDFTGVSCEPGMAAIRRWVRDGEIDLSREDAVAAVEDLAPRWRRPGCGSASAPTWPARATRRRRGVSCWPPPSWPPTT